MNSTKQSMMYKMEQNLKGPNMKVVPTSLLISGFDT